MKKNQRSNTHLRADNTLMWFSTLLLALLASCSSHKSQENIASDFDPEKDYFPIKASIDHAIGFDIVYHNSWKEVLLFRHYNDFVDTVRFALVQNGAPDPKGFEAQRTVEIPVQRLASMSTTHLGMFEMLDAFDNLKGIERAEYVSSTIVKGMVASGQVAELEPSGTLNTELAVNEGIELLLGVGYPNAQNDAYQSLENAGVPVLLNADWQEKTLLGRAEWVKLLAALLNKEALVNSRFGAIEDEFNNVLTQVENEVKTGPTVITGIAQGDAWFVAGGRSFAYYLLDLAKVVYPWKNSEQTGSIRLDFETVYEEGLKADFWMVPSTAKTLNDIRQADARYTDFKAYKNRNIYNIYGRYTEGGGNDYYESAVMNPHIVLKDNIKIFHPELLPDHELVYYNRLK
ncbi:ABC transporter substrate-binding protein [Roseivirga sp.]|uniref:ABC transporter substrate-binding protein n=1 Tax=Roseivirga sp. TaxID=1964215 RepID=UPI003B8CA4E8